MVRPVGFEPTTNRFEVCDSIQLSYGRKIRQYPYARGFSEGNQTRHQPFIVKFQEDS